VAGVDIGIMVLYFSILSYLRRSPISNILNRKERKLPSDPFNGAIANSFNESALETISKNGEGYRVGKLSALVLSLVITSVSSRIQKAVGTPGVSVLFSTLFALAFSSLANMLFFKDSGLQKPQYVEMTSKTTTSVIDVQNFGQSFVSNMYAGSKGNLIQYQLVFLNHALRS
jgi:hypothetical protein